MKISFCLFLFLMLYSAAAEKSFACSCAASLEPMKKQIEQAFTGSDAIFSGAVVEIKESPTDKDSVLVKFKIAKSWKGDSSAEMTINTAKESAMCGYGFEIGKTYLVYASGMTKNLSVYNCSRTAVFSHKGDVKYLTKLKRKTKAG